MIKDIKSTIEQFKKYKEYISYSIKSELSVNISNTYLGYLWWLLDPLFYMLIYVFVVVVVFRRGGPDFPIFVFCALLSWKWTATVVSKSSTAIKSKANILKQIYLPKIIIPFINTSVGLIYYLFSLIMLFIMMPFFNITFTWHIIESIPVIIVHFLFLLGFTSVLSHIGVYVSDLKNILTVFTRFWFYMSPGLYSIEDLPSWSRNIMYLNPMATFYTSYRNVFMYGKSPQYLLLLVWLVVSLGLIVLSIKLFKKHDTNYTKVI